MRDLGLKAAALLCAALLWFYTVSDRTYSVERILPVRLSGLPEGLAVINTSILKVPVMLEGNGRALMRMGGDDAVIDVDAHNARIGNNRFALRSDMLKSDYPIRILGINASPWLDIHCDTRIHVPVPVRIQVEAVPADGYLIVGGPDAEPGEVQINGARQLVAKISAIPTEAVRLSGISRDTILTVALLDSTTRGKVEADRDSVNIQIRVQPLARRTFDSVPIVLVGHFDVSQWSLQPNTASIEVSGGKTILDAMQASDISAFIEFSRFQIEDSDSLSPVITLRTPCQSWSIRPEKFRLVHAEAPRSEGNL